MIRSRSSKRRSVRRNGFALAMVLVGMTIATLLLVVIVQRVVVFHQRVIQRQQTVQSQQIAESAIELARQRLDSDPDYQGEDWLIPSDNLPDHRAGRAEIVVESEEDQLKSIRVVAVYPDRDLGIRTERRAIYAVETPNE